MLFKLPQRQRLEQTLEGQREVQVTVGDRAWVRRADGKVYDTPAVEPVRAMTNLLLRPAPAPSGRPARAVARRGVRTT